MMAFSSRSRRSRGAALFRGLALLLAAAVAGQMLPFAFTCGVSLRPESADATPRIRPLQICDDGAGYAGFLSDHPWLPRSAASPPSRLTAAVIRTPAPAGLAEGHPVPVFRPPRPVFS